MTDQTPTVLNDDTPADGTYAAPARKSRSKAEVSPDMLAQLREQIRAEVKAELAEERATQAIASNPAARLAAASPEGIVAEFWSTSKDHKLRIKRPFGQGFITFHEGYFAARNEADADLVRSCLQGQAWEKDWPDHIARPRDPMTGFSPGAWGAWQAFQRWIGADIPG